MFIFLMIFDKLFKQKKEKRQIIQIQIMKVRIIVTYVCFIYYSNNNKKLTDFSANIEKNHRCF